MPKIEYNSLGHYCLVFPDGTRSRYEGYQFVLNAIWQNRKFIAFSDFWKGSETFELAGVHEIK